MLGNFSYHNTTKLYFGPDSLDYLNEELPKYGTNVQLIYGGGSIKKNGIYDAVVAILKKNGQKIADVIRAGGKPVQSAADLEAAKRVIAAMEGNK